MTAEQTPETGPATASETQPTAGLCPVCRDPFHGGPRRYLDVAKKWRVACDDEHACLAAYVRNGQARTRASRGHRS